MAPEGRTIDQFGYDVRMVVAAEDLTPFKVFPCVPLLDPEIRHRQVAHAPPTPAATYPYGGGAVREDLQVAGEAKVHA